MTLLAVRVLVTARHESLRATRDNQSGAARESRVEPAADEVMAGRLQHVPENRLLAMLRPVRSEGQDRIRA